MRGSTGYAGTPLAEKPGIKEGFKVAVLGQPDYYLERFTDLPPIEWAQDEKVKKNFIHYFIKQKEHFRRTLPN